MVLNNYPMPDWYDKAIVMIEAELNDGFITHKEFRERIHELNEEYDEYIEKDRDNYE